MDRKQEGRVSEELSLESRCLLIYECFYPCIISNCNKALYIFPFCSPVNQKQYLFLWINMQVLYNLFQYTKLFQIKRVWNIQNIFETVMLWNRYCFISFSNTWQSATTVTLISICKCSKHCHQFSKILKKPRLSVRMCKTEVI